jgi:hypothetical protein
MLICEDILLLLTRDDGRTEAWVTYRPYALAAGLLADLALADCIEFEADKKNPKVTLAGELAGAGGTPGAGGAGASTGAGAPTGAPVGRPGGPDGIGEAPAVPDGPGAIMDFGLRALADRNKPPRVQTLVTAGWFNPQEVVSRSLVAQGVVGLEEKKLLGLKPERYPVLDPEPENRTRARLADALAGRGPVAPADAMILGILQGIDAVKHVLSDEVRQAGLKDREAKKRIESLADELPEDAQQGSRAVKGVIDSMNAAILGAVVASTAAGTAAAGN